MSDVRKDIDVEVEEHHGNKGGARMQLGICIDLGSRQDLHSQIMATRHMLDRAEAAGLDSVWIGESYHREPKSFHLPRPLLILSHLAAYTRMRIGTGVLLLRAYDPVALSYEAALLDQISQGRFTLGIGLGNASLRGMIGYSGSDASGFLDQGLATLRDAWNTRADSCCFRPIPGPLQRNGPPILVAGRGKQAIARAVKYGEGYYAATNYSDELLRAQAVAYRNAGGDGSVVVNRLCIVHRNGHEARRLSEDYFRDIIREYQRAGLWGIMPDGTAEPTAGVVLAGSPIEVLQKMQVYSSWGVTAVNLRLLPFGYTCQSAEGMLDLLRTEILPALNDG